MPAQAEWSAAFARDPRGDKRVLIPIRVEECEPEGILAQPRRQRRSLEKAAEARRGLELFSARVAAIWPRIREIDFAELSRFQVEETRGWRPRREPGELAGEVIAHDEVSGHWFLELRGPRLPARYDIVHRHLWVFARYDPATAELDRLTVTIRGWVEE